MFTKKQPEPLFNVSDPRVKQAQEVANRTRKPHLLVRNDLGGLDIMSTQNVSLDEYGDTRTPVAIVHPEPLPMVDAESVSRAPDAWVPIHPKHGPLWANTLSDLDSDRPGYPIRPLYFGWEPRITEQDAKAIHQSAVMSTGKTWAVWEFDTWMKSEGLRLINKLNASTDS